MLQIEDLLEADYCAIHAHTRSMVMLLSELSEAALQDAAIELGVDYELFLADYRGPPYPFDAYEGFAEMLQQWPVPWPDDPDSALGDLTITQFYLVWARHQNELAKYCLDGRAAIQGWKISDALECGVVAAVCAAKSLTHAQVLTLTASMKSARDAARKLYRSMHYVTIECGDAPPEQPARLA